MPRRGAKALIVDSQNRALILRRSKTHRYVPFTQDLPGGKVEEGESMLAGLLREIHEEVGLELDEQVPQKCERARYREFLWQRLPSRALRGEIT